MPSPLPGPVADPLGALGVREGDLIGETYRIERVLGVGGMGVVARALDVKLERHVAIKFVNPDVFAVPAIHEHFAREAKAMARIAHRNVLAVYAFGEHDGTPYFVMEYVEGRTAADWLADRPAGTLPPTDEVIDLIEQVCHGVEAIHASDLVHRDLKPSNILIDRDRRVAVGDFGLSCLAGLTSAEGVPVGTAAYMAPESALSEATAFELARDVYALGCIAYEMLVGRTPFVGSDPMHIMSKHFVETPQAPSVRRPSLGTVYDDVILKALAKDPAHRHRSVAAFREALGAAHRGTDDPPGILVADDDDDWRALTVSFLQRRFPGAAIDQAADGVSAMDAFFERRHAVILLDLEMPEMDGTKLTLALRSIDSAQRSAIIVLTAAGGPNEWRMLSAIGADGFLVKPIDPDDLELVIRRALKSRRTSVLPPAP